MITGATRGAGTGHALADHLLKEENAASVISPRGLGSSTLREQVRELVALSAAGRTDRPIYHVFCSPDPAVADDPRVRVRFWSLFEREFDMAGQPYAGVEHRKDGRLHEHRVYGIVRPSGAVVNLSWDFARREKCARIIEYEHGMEAVPSKHARAVLHRLRADGRSDVADWLVGSGTTRSARPVAARSPGERLIEERTGTDLDAVRRLALASWREATDGTAFAAALRRRGLDLRQGRVGPVILDASGTPHLATRLIGAAARRFEGERITAATVKAQLGNLTLEKMSDGHAGTGAPSDCPGSLAARDPGGTGAAGGRGLGVRRPGRDSGRPDRGGGGRGRRGQDPALDRLRAVAPGHGLVVRRGVSGLSKALAGNIAAVDRARHAAERIEDLASSKRDRAMALWGKTDIWGLPLS